MSLLEVDDLRVVFSRKGGPSTTAVDGVSFSVDAGEVVGLVGESGCGKSVTSLAVMGLLPQRTATVTGAVRFDGTDLLTLSPAQLARRRGRDLAMVFQDPMTSLNPVLTLGRQLTEVLRTHTDLDRAAAKREAVELLGRVGIPDPRRRVGEYPHQLSGGMRQRVLIAIALACSPRLIIADEPTTALDVTIQAQVLDLLTTLVRESGTAMVLITHDLGVVAGTCDRVNVLYAGRVVEQAGRNDLFAQPRHRYTTGLLAAVPRVDAPEGTALQPVPGSVRDRLEWAQGCAFAPRCGFADDACRRGDIALTGPAGSPHLARCVHPAADALEATP
ncbi:ABC transporter ATP-binding protein [Kineococcus radiotolerans]|uniref:Oligopeptide/dipeptide ABC transporter, ATPase subunit n=1 Tax=Kineococcus radiotolerans (strain ATCC BAA-149 / DSM 14245 / SRS30216) TaxID=266940 RepID=A6WCC0_KINRD|nr:oligopeptide/dipeptide ABC transporter ATP-binding protein [Kineococcus radiotolerans]ABS04459.1 oligopeptide/dipeptide ABC transporter, ATPase subunit [Kineococcus radiotolerans SRS30216 = ATCC BAA-149]